METLLNYIKMLLPYKAWKELRIEACAKQLQNDLNNGVDINDIEYIKMKVIVYSTSILHCAVSRLTSELTKH